MKKKEVKVEPKFKAEDRKGEPLKDKGATRGTTEPTTNTWDPAALYF